MLATSKDFVTCTGKTTLGLSLIFITTDNPSCFDATHLSIDIGTASTHSAKLPFFQKAVAVVVIVNLLHIKYCEEWSEEVYVCDKLNI